jgi:hypothetical protein
LSSAILTIVHMERLVGDGRYTNWRDRADFALRSSQLNGGSKMMTTHLELNSSQTPTLLHRESFPALLPGVQLVQTAAAAVHLVGDIENPVSLVGVEPECVRWLNEVDGRLSWDAQIWHAEVLGVSAELAEAVLQQLDREGLLVDAATGKTPDSRGFARAHVFGNSAVVSKLKELVPTMQPRGCIPSPRQGPDWRNKGERLADDAAPLPAVVVLAQPLPSSSEVEFVATLAAAQVRHLVVAAGAQTARVGPYTAAQGGPCLRCDLLAHADADQVWRRIGAQLSLDEPPAGSPPVLLAALAAAEATRQMSALDAGHRATAENAVLQSGYRGGAWRRRLIVRHQHCSCWWPRSAAKR